MRGDPSVFQVQLGHVFYCIGKTSNFGADPIATFEAHCGFLVRFLAEARYEKVVYLSSVRLYDGLSAGVEDDPLNLLPTNPRHLFDLTKATGEHFTLLHGKNGGGCVARLAAVYGTGAGATGFLSELLRRLPKARCFDINSVAAASRDYIHVDDTVAALVRLMERGEPQDIYNIASGVNVTNAEIVDLLRAAGWQIGLSGATAQVPVAPAISNSKLLALGIAPRQVSTYLVEFFKGVKCP